MKRFIFANQLRGIAVILVLFSHWFGVFWGMRETVATYTSSPIQLGDSPLIYHLISDIPNVSFGPIGVSIFFLISGFVIPFSLEKGNSWEFLVARLFRIFPTYWVGLILGLIGVWIASRLWNRPLILNCKILLSNMFLYNGFIQMPSLDMVNWTLAIECIFYILAALFAKAIHNANVKPIFIFSGAVLIGNWKIVQVVEFLHIFPEAIRYLVTALMYVQFMLIGCFFFHAIREKISNRRLYFYVAIQLFLVCVTWRLGLQNNYFPVVPFNYFLGLCVFSVCFHFREKFKSRPFLDQIASVSFPLYVTHALGGYLLLKLLSQWGLSFYASASIAFSVVFFIVTLIHLYIEKPSIRLGEFFINKIKRYQGESIRSTPYRVF